MNIKNTTEVKSVSFPKLSKYRFYGFTFEVPFGQLVQNISVKNRQYILETSENCYTLKACLKCKRLLEYDKFYDGKSPCKSCHIFLVKSWQKRNAEMHKVNKRRSNKRYRDRKREKAA
jgi:PHP family Zn ribbon phosphoesterase